ncbi:MAG: methyltransferase domain-containing protein [Novosphingobium sp.]|nr:methyltransferase domain-containing protein [Novosphingobium sp.]MCB2079829.1 methyltransferase domain-containing protein [Novosphingobium sp.]
MTGEPEFEFPPGAFARADEGDDAVFYEPPRLVTHIDDQAIATLRDYYAKVLKPESTVLDLMSSWVSHLPDDLPLAEVIGHGMNEAELRANPRLTRWFIQDFNHEPVLPLENDSCDAALCCVSVQYLQQPVEVFSEVRRISRPGSPFIVTYSNRCFPTKAVAIWRSLDLRRHSTLIHVYLTRAGFSDIDVQVLANGMSGDPLVAVTGLA